jgi:hypothetical protein
VPSCARRFGARSRDVIASTKLPYVRDCTATPAAEQKKVIRASLQLARMRVVLRIIAPVVRGSSHKGSSSLTDSRFHFVNWRANIGLCNSRSETIAGYISNDELWFVIDAKEQSADVLADDS